MGHQGKADTHRVKGGSGRGKAAISQGKAEPHTGTAGQAHTNGAALQGKADTLHAKARTGRERADTGQGKAEPHMGTAGRHMNGAALRGALQGKADTLRVKGKGLAGMPRGKAETGGHHMKGGHLPDTRGNISQGKAALRRERKAAVIPRNAIQREGFPTTGEDMTAR
jgi:hypothetical protein